MIESSAAKPAGADLHTRLLSTQIHWVIETTDDKQCIAAFSYQGDAAAYLKAHKDRATACSLHKPLQARNLNDGVILK